MGVFLKILTSFFTSFFFAFGMAALSGPFEKHSDLVIILQLLVVFSAIALALYYIWSY